MEVVMSTFIEGVALYAVGGDIPGMGAPEERRYRSLDGADPNLVRAFLDAQTASAVYALTGTNFGSNSRKRYEYGNQLIEAGVFESKYDVRSTWILTEQV
jgi:hypothetical protein